jgi:hypothetical protein
METPDVPEHLISLLRAMDAKSSPAGLMAIP